MKDYIRMRYGLPYMGSKNKIAEWVVSHFPEKKHFYDLFAGGCAVAHCAMLKGKFESCTVNDISRAPELFTDAIKGKYAGEKRWISRSDFSALKDNDEYVRVCWSFGNKGADYLYSKEIEPWKKALHYARVYGDFSLMEEFGIKTDGTRIDIRKNAAEYREKYTGWYLRNVLKSAADLGSIRKSLSVNAEEKRERLRAYLLEGLRKAGKTRAEVDRYLGTNGMARHYFGRSQWEFPTRGAYIKLQSFLCLPEDYDEIYGLQSLLERLERLERLKSLESLQSFRGDYRSVRIEPDSLIYCDIPYKGTAEYSGGAFDYESFYGWAEKQTEPVIISEYAMPEDRFERIARIKKRSLLCGGSKLFREEGLFVPRAQIERGIFKPRKEWRQQELFPPEEGGQGEVLR